MATPVIISKDQFKYEFTLARDGDNATRSFTIDTNAPSAALSAAIELQGIFAGSASSPFNLINPNQLIQPAGWRDNDPNEDPWTTAKVGLVQVHTDETYYGELPDGGGGGGQLETEYDPDENLITIHYTGTETPRAFYAKGDEITLQTGNPTYWFITNVTTGTYYVFAGNEAKVVSASS